MVKTCPKCGYTGEDFSAKVKVCRPCKREQNKIDNAIYQFGNRHSTYYNKYPVPSIGVYAIMEGRDIVYIGSSDAMAFRLYLHFDCKKTTASRFVSDMSPLQKHLKYKWNVLWYGDDYEDAKHQEKMLIQIHQPKFNKIKYKNYEK